MKSTKARSAKLALSEEVLARLNEIGKARVPGETAAR
jgi:hypothetical protein